MSFSIEVLLGAQGQMALQKLFRPPTLCEAENLLDSGLSRNACSFCKHRHTMGYVRRGYGSFTTVSRTVCLLVCRCVHA